MIKKLLFPFLLATTLPMAWAQEPENLEAAKIRVQTYYTSGEYEQDVNQSYQKAATYLDNYLKKYPNTKPAVVFDIDETVLSNYHNMVFRNFGGSQAEIKKLVDGGKNPAIQPALAFYKTLLQKKVAVFFITGRRESYRKNTEANLKEEGFRHFSKLILKPENYTGKSSTDFKKGARATIEKEGYTVVLNIGDQQSDLSGGYAKHTIKLPNPFYAIP